MKSHTFSVSFKSSATLFSLRTEQSILDLLSSSWFSVYLVSDDKKNFVLPSTQQCIDNNGGNNTTTNDSAPTASAGIIQIGGFIRTRYHLSTDHKDEIITPEEAVKALGQRVQPNNVIRQYLHFVRIRYQIVSRLELEATRNVTFCVVNFPALLITMDCFECFIPDCVIQILSIGVSAKKKRLNHLSDIAVGTTGRIRTRNYYLLSVTVFTSSSVMF